MQAYVRLSSMLECKLQSQLVCMDLATHNVVIGELTTGPIPRLGKECLGMRLEPTLAALLGSLALAD